MIFYLSSDGTRSMLHTEEDLGRYQHNKLDWSSRAQPINAKSWLAAKKAFGFELTPLQNDLLKRQEVQ